MMPESRLEIVEIGPVARRALAPGAAGEVRAVFERSFYAVLDGQWICFGPRALGAGPLNALYAPGPAEGWCGLLAAGEPAHVMGHEIRIGEFGFGFGSAADWNPAGSATADRQALAAGLRALDAVLAGLMPQDGLAVLMRPAIRRESLPALARAAEGAVRRLGDLVRAVPATGTIPDFAPLSPLLGLGPGLTPSGDDVIGGALVALRRLGRADLADAIRTWLETVTDRTNDVSLAHLRAAAEGCGAAALHEILDDLLHGRAADLPPALAAIGSIGHTSGWDALAGAVVVLRAWLGAPSSGAGGLRPPLSAGL